MEQTQLRTDALTTIDVIAATTRITLFKAVSLSGMSHKDGTTEWVTGRTVEVFEAPKDGKSCGVGLHASPTLLDAVGYQTASSRYLRVYGEESDLCGKDAEKNRYTRLVCGEYLSDDEADAIAGFKLFEANYAENPFLIEANPSLDTLALLKLWVSVYDSVRDSVKNSVWASVWTSVRASVYDSVYAYIGGLFPSITDWKYIDAGKLPESVSASDPWRPLLKLWYGGYVPSFDGTVWRLHSGKDAKIVLTWNPETNETTNLTQLRQPQS